MTSNQNNTNSSQRGFHPSTFLFKTDVSTKQIPAQGQKVICTPEVSLYQYAKTHDDNDDAMVPNPITKLAQTHTQQQHTHTQQQLHAAAVLAKMSAGSNGELDLGSTGSASPINRSNSLSSSGSGGTGFQCGFCGKSFQQKNTFQNHLRSHRDVNGPDAYQCDICNKTFAVPARLTRHYRTHTGEKPYQCEYCNKSFSVKENLSVHRRIHTKERPYKCEVCERAFEHSGKLHRHMRIHTGERPHQCQVCQKTFIQSGQLVIHMRTHTGEKPYVCKVCNKGFTCSKQLKVHTRTHTGEKPYSCEICGKSFGYNHVLKLHQVAHYGEKVYKCTLCNSTFNSKKSLETHIKTHSGGDSPHSSLDDVAVVPEQRIMHSPSSSHISLTPISSDKENREMSDSDLSSSLSQSSPLTTPTSPTPPRSHSPGDEYILPTTIPSGGKNGGHHYNGNGGSSSHHQSLPYPMLPPSVQVHQAPQSRTTFLYVTSKLPQHSSSSSSSSSSDQVLPTMRSNGGNGNGNNSSSNINFKTFGFSGQKGSSFDERDKHFLQSASIRDKVLASIEKFGYGLQSSGSGSGSGNDMELVCHPSSSNNGSGKSNNSNSSHYPTNSFVQQIRRNNSIPENLTMPNGKTNGNSNGGSRQGRGDHFFNPYARVVGGGSGSSSLRTIAMMKDHQQRSSPLISQGHQRHFNENSNSNDEESFDRLKSMYPSGGVLALALTRGSKVAATASQLGPHTHSVSVTPIGGGGHYSNHNHNSCPSPVQERPDSPQELCIDFSRRPHEDSPSPPPRQSSPSGYSEGSYEELSDEGQDGSGRPMRSRPSLGGPRKRSSLILEKYAQETVPSAVPAQGADVTAKSESILSQRLRLSSVIQYAEKCT